MTKQQLARAQSHKLGVLVGLIEIIAELNQALISAAIQIDIQDCPWPVIELYPPPDRPKSKVA